PDGKTLASGSMDQTVKLWDTATGQLRETIVPGETGTSSGMRPSGAIGSVSAGPGVNPPNPPTPAPDPKLKLADELFRKTAELQEAQSRLLSKLTEAQEDPPTAKDVIDKQQLRKRIEEEFRHD